MAKNIELTAPLSETTELTVREFKDKYLEEVLDDGKYGCRLIWNGKELKDSHPLTEFEFDESPLFYVFLFNLAEHFDTRKMTTLKTDHSKGVDFDYFIEKNVASEEEISWKRYCFHGPYIMRSKIESVSDYHLFMREIDFMGKNIELRKEKKKFKGCKFGDYDENEPLEVKPLLRDNKLLIKTFFLILVCMAFGPLSIVMLHMPLDKFLKRVISASNVLFLVGLTVLNITNDVSALSVSHLLVQFLVN